MSDRQPATDKGTADRMEADNGGYWVPLVTKQALGREGECMIPETIDLLSAGA